MRNVSSDLGNAGQSLNRTPVSRVTLEASRLDFSEPVVASSNDAAFALVKTTYGAAVVYSGVDGSLWGNKMTSAEATAGWPAATDFEVASITNGDIALAADGDNCDLYSFDGTSLHWMRSIDGGATYSAPDNLGDAVASGWLHCGTASPDCVAWTVPYAAMADGMEFSDIKLSIYTDSTWTTYTNSVRQKLDFNARDLKISVAKIGDRYLVVYSGQTSTKDVDIQAVWFHNGIWSIPKNLVTIDFEYGMHYAQAPVLSLVGDELWMFYALRTPHYNGSTLANEYLSCMHTSDGDNWSEMDILINDTGVMHALMMALGDSVLCAYHKNSDLVTYRCVSKGISLTGNLHADNTLDVSRDISNWSLQLPADSAASSEIVLYNTLSRYANNATKEYDLLTRPCLIKIEAGYRVAGVDLYDTMATHDLYIPEHQTSFAQNEVSLSGEDFATRAGLWRANTEWIYDSQVRLLDNLREQYNTTGMRGLWSGTGNGVEAKLQSPSIIADSTSKYAQLSGKVLLDGVDAPVGTEILAVSPRGHVVGAVTIATAGEYPVLSIFQEELMTSDQLSLASYMTRGQYSGSKNLIVGAKQGEDIHFIVGSGAVDSAYTFDCSIDGYQDWNLAALRTNTQPTLATTVHRAQALINRYQSAKPTCILRFRFKIPERCSSGYVGCGMNVINDIVEMESGYMVVYDVENDQFRIIKETHALWDVTTPLATQSGTVGWSDRSTFLYVMVMDWYGTLKAYYSSDNVTWSHAVTYVPTDPPEHDDSYSTFECQGIDKHVIWFSDMTVCDMEDDKYLEQIIKNIGFKCGIATGIFDDDLYDSFETTTLNTESWTAALPGTWHMSGDSFIGGVAASGSDYTCYRSKVDSANFIGEMEISPWDGEGGWMFNSDANMTNCYMATIKHYAVCLYRVEAGVFTKLYECPLFFNPVPEKHFLKISRQDNFVGLWLNGLCILSYYTATAARSDNNYVGICVIGDTYECHFGLVHIPELDDYIEDHTVSQNQSGQQALEEMLGKRHIRWFVNGDGALRVSRFLNRTAVVTYNNNLLDSVKTPSNKEWFSHVQVQGAGANDFGDRINLATTIAKGYRYVKTDNPDVMTPKDTYVEATAIQIETEERGNLREFTAPAVVQQERQDLIKIINAKDGTTSDVDFTVQALTFEYAVDLESKSIIFDMSLSSSLALERVKKSLKQDEQSGYVSGKIVRINISIRCISVQIYGSSKRIDGVAVPLGTNMDTLRYGDRVLLAVVNGRYMLLQAYKEATPTEPYRWHWYADGTSAGDAEILWDDDTCSMQGRKAFWG